MGTKTLEICGLSSHGEVISSTPKIKSINLYMYISRMGPRINRQRGPQDSTSTGYIKNAIVGNNTIENVKSHFLQI